jgi:hypothetical protein
MPKLEQCKDAGPRKTLACSCVESGRRKDKEFRRYTLRTLEAARYSHCTLPPGHPLDANGHEELARDQLPKDTASNSKGGNAQLRRARQSYSNQHATTGAKGGDHRGTRTRQGRRAATSAHLAARLLLRRPYAALDANGTFTVLDLKDEDPVGALRSSHHGQKLLCR